MDESEFVFMERLKKDKGEDDDSFFDDFHSVVEGIKPHAASAPTSSVFEDEDEYSSKEEFDPPPPPEHLAYYRDTHLAKRNKSVDLRPGTNPFAEHYTPRAASQRRYQSDSTLASLNSSGGNSSKARSY